MARTKESRGMGDEIGQFDEEGEIGSSSGSSGKSKQLLFELLGRWYWPALGLALGILGAYYYLSKAPEVYKSTATLLINHGGGNQGDTVYGSVEEYNTLLSGFRKSDFLDKVASVDEVLELEGLVPPETNWFPDWTNGWLGGEVSDPIAPGDLPPGKLASMIGTWMNVGLRRDTFFIDVSVSHPEPEVCSVLASTIAQGFEKDLKEMREVMAKYDADFFDLKSSKLGLVLEQKQNALSNYTTALDALNRLKDAEAHVLKLDETYLERHPKMVSGKTAVANARAAFLREFELVRSSAIDKEWWIKNQILLNDKNVDKVKELQIARRLFTNRQIILSNEISTQKRAFDETYAAALKRRGEQRADVGDLRVESLAGVPKVPFSPLRESVITSGALIGFGSGILFAFLLVKLDSKVHTISQVEVITGLPVLATIHYIAPKILKKIVSNKGLPPTSDDPIAQGWDPRIVFRPGLTETLYCEMFRILRASISLLGDEKKRRVTLFSSALPGEGKTLVSVNFAIASAQQGRKTLLMDLDLRKPSVHRVFGLKRSELKAGATELLAGQVSSLKEALSEDTGQKNLTCLYAGSKAPNPGELLNSSSVRDLLELLKDEFDVIVIDSAPLLAVSDTRLLVPIVDNFCLVVRAEHAPKGSIRKVLGLLDDDGRLPAGVVVNGYEEKSSLLARKHRYGYGYGGYGQYTQGYGYGSYGSYGSDDSD